MFRFTIRDALWLMVVVVVLAGVGFMASVVWVSLIEEQKDREREQRILRSATLSHALPILERLATCPSPWRPASAGE